MPCQHVQLPGGFAIVCTRRRERRKRCSTPGCHNWADRECDHPVKKRTTPTPKAGDARLHREQQAIFWVHAVLPDGKLSVSPTSVDDPKPKTTAVTVEAWLAKTDATCCRPVCSRCAVRVGRLEYCGPHGRASQQRATA